MRSSLSRSRGWEMNDLPGAIRAPHELVGGWDRQQEVRKGKERPLADLDVVYVYLDGFALRVRTAGKVVSVPVLGVVGVLTDGRKHLLALELCAGESLAAWKGCLDDLVARGLRAPVLAIIDGNAGLRRAVGRSGRGRPCNAVVSTSSGTLS